MAKKVQPEILLATPQGIRIVGFLKKKFPKKTKSEKGLYDAIDSFCSRRNLQKEYQMNSPTAENSVDWAKLWKAARRLQKGKQITPPPPRGERIGSDESVIVSKIRVHKAQKPAYNWWAALTPKKRMELIESHYEKIKHLLAGEEE